MPLLLYFQKGREGDAAPAEAHSRTVVVEVGTPGCCGDPRRGHGSPQVPQPQLGEQGGFGPPSSAISFSTALGVSSAISGLDCYLVTSLSRGTCTTLQASHPCRCPQWHSSGSSACTEHPDHPRPCLNIDCLEVTGARNQH